MKGTRTAAAAYGELIPAMGYIRVSTDRQAEKYSPGNQREGIRAFARQQGYHLLAIEQDVQRGRVIERTGYQRILDGARAGTVHAVIVFMFDRWGRDGAEWAARARELERLRVPFLSVQEGREEGGIMRFVRAGMAEEGSRQIARRVRPAREEAARQGRYLAPAPFGYVKRYPERLGGMPRSTGLLEVDPAAAPVVHTIFQMYAEGGQSQPQIARHLNESPGVPPAPGGGAWSAERISYILRNPVYIGQVRYNRRQCGYYETSQPGDEFTAEGTHQPIISRDLWQAAHARLDGRVLPVRAYRAPRELLMGEGILRCAHCHARMMLGNLERKGRQSKSYKCAGRHRGATSCAGSCYSARMAHAALVAQLCRIRYQPWDEQMAEQLADGSDQAAELSEVERRLERTRSAMRRHMRAMAEREDDPTPAEVQEHRAVGRELAAEIEALAARAAELREAPASIEELRMAHAALATVDVAAEVAALEARGDDAALALLVRRFIDFAELTWRVPERHTRWGRATVQWTGDTALLIQMGSIALASDPEPPVTAYDPKARHREAVQRHRARKRAGLV